MRTPDSVEPVGANQAQFEGARLFATDFDGTTHLTSEEAPGIATVNDAYRDAIDETLGASAVQTFLRQGGHQHRTPAEIVSDISPDMDTLEVAEASSRITHLKLEVLMGQIGKELPGGDVWPRPTNGFVKFWQSLQQDRERGITIDTAVLSAGHTEFITKTFAVHELAQPDILVTDDVLIGFNLGYLPPDMRAKPAPLPLAVAKLLWLGRHGMRAHDDIDMQALNARIMFAGDSEAKDGGLAQSAGVDFVHVDPDTSHCAWGEARQWAAGARPYRARA